MSLLSARLGRVLWRKLLQLDQATPDKTETEITAEVEHNYRWNFTVNLLDGIVFWFGLNFISSSTIIPFFISKLTPNPLVIGLVAVIAQAGWYLPQLLTAGYIENLARKKPVSVNLGFFSERLPAWLWPLAALVAPFSPLLALLLFFWGYAWHALGAGLIAPAWQDLIARCFPVQRRGRFFGLTTFIGTGVGALGAIFSGWLLEAYPFPVNFAYVFLIGAVAINLSWAFQALTREPVQAVVAVPYSSRQLFSKLTQIVRRDDNFRQFLQAKVLLALGLMGLGFVTVAAVQRLQVAESTIGYFTVALLVGQTGGNLLSGWLSDRFGHKLPLEITGTAAALAFALAWASPAIGWYYLIFFLLGSSIGATIVSGMLIALEFSAPAQRPTYVGISNTIFGIGSGIAPLIGGWLASIGYNWLFVVSACLSLAGVLLMRWRVVDPRWTSREAIRVG